MNDDIKSIFKNIPDDKAKDIIETLSQTKSLEEFCEAAKKYGLTLEEDIAKKLFTNLTNILSDDDLAKVAGGVDFYY